MSANISTSKRLFPPIQIRRSLVFGTIIIAALCAFELFNYSTTEYALSDLLGELAFAGISWATILSVAFCGIDFAGIAQLFTPQSSSRRGAPFHSETWYLFGAWLLAATMNAMLTWWGVSLAIASHNTFGAQVLERTTLLRVVPIFVALLVWLIRVLIIGTFSVGGETLFPLTEVRPSATTRSQPRPSVVPSTISSRPQSVRPSVQVSPANMKAESKSDTAQADLNYPNRTSPSYHPLTASAPGSPRIPQGSETRKTGTSFRH